ncbi:MAG TPA: ABC transporter permease, partial [Gemmatimonadaceae bacterium]
QVTMNLIMMPMFFLSGALFPVGGLPGWLAVLTRLDPATYGMDPLRRVVLGAEASAFSGGGVAGMTLFGEVLSIPVELTVLTAFAFVMLGIAVRNFRVQD